MFYFIYLVFPTIKPEAREVAKLLNYQNHLFKNMNKN